MGRCELIQMIHVNPMVLWWRKVRKRPLPITSKSGESGVKMPESQFFVFYQLFFEFQYKTGIIPFTFDPAVANFRCNVTKRFRIRNAYCNFVFCFIVCQEILLISINLWTGCVNERIKNSLIFQVSWLLVFLLITSVLFQFEFNSKEIIQTCTEWVHLEYFVTHEFGFPDPLEKMRKRTKLMILIFKTFVYSIRFGSSGLVALFWFDPRFPIFLYSFFSFESELADYSALVALLIKLTFALFECSFLIFILGIYTLGFLLLPIISLSLINCLDKLHKVKGQRTVDGERILLVYKRLETLMFRLELNYRGLILIMELVSLIATSVFMYALITFTESLFQTLFFLIVVSFFVGIMGLLYYPLAALNRRSMTFLTFMHKTTVGKQGTRILHTCKPLIIQPFRLHSVKHRTIVEYATLVTNHVVLCICM